MALAATTTDRQLDLVVTTLLSHYPAGAAIASGWSFRSHIVHVEVPAEAHIELIIPDDEPLAPLGHQVACLAAESTVTVVVGCHRMGTAHRALRGTGALIQPWWETEDTIHFGRAERT